MYKAIGVNMDKEYKALRKKSKRFVPPSHYRDNYSMNNSKEDNMEDYSFFDSMEDLKDCANSNDENCKIRSCLLNKEIQVNKKVLIASGIIGVTCAMKKMNSKSSKSLLAAAPSLMKFAKTML